MTATREGESAPICPALVVDGTVEAPTDIVWAAWLHDIGGRG